MKLSVSLPDTDVAVLDEYVRETELPSRSAALQRAIRLLQHVGLEEDYASAWDEWAISGEQANWEASVGDGEITG